MLEESEQFTVLASAALVSVAENCREEDKESLVVADASSGFTEGVEGHSSQGGGGARNGVNVRDSSACDGAAQLSSLSPMSRKVAVTDDSTVHAKASSVEVVSPLPPLPPTTAPPASILSILETFYTERNPDRMSNVPKILATYAGRELFLLMEF